MGNWPKISVLKMEEKCTDEMLVGVQMTAIWKCNRVRCLERINPNHFDDRLWLRHFRMIKPTFEILCNYIFQLVSPVIQSHPLLGQFFNLY